MKAVVFDVDFTLARPGPDLGAEGYCRVASRHGLALDASRYDDARRAAFDALERHPELDYDEGIWVLFTQRILEGMAGDIGPYKDIDTYDAAVELTRAWETAAHFELYDDVLDTLALLRSRGLKIGLLSNRVGVLDDFVVHHALNVDAHLTSSVHGKTKPHASIFKRLLAALQVEPDEAVMVGDTLEDDIEGARAIGMRAILLDRAGRHPGVPGRLESLRELPAALALD
ncbi:MAG TPA: HAD family hydrolase [Gaiellaceae bacterium]